jgi:hypothetical protein
MELPWITQKWPTIIFPRYGIIKCFCSSLVRFLVMTWGAHGGHYENSHVHNHRRENIKSYLVNPYGEVQPRRQPSRFLLLVRSKFLLFSIFSLRCIHLCLRPPITSLKEHGGSKLHWGRLHLRNLSFLQVNTFQFSDIFGCLNKWYSLLLNPSEDIQTFLFVWLPPVSGETVAFPEAEWTWLWPKEQICSKSKSLHTLICVPHFISVSFECVLLYIFTTQ